MGLHPAHDDVYHEAYRMAIIACPARCAYWRASMTSSTAQSTILLPTANTAALSGHELQFRKDYWLSDLKPNFSAGDP